MSSVATADGPSRTLVLGLGNPILGDDGIGWHVIDELERRLSRTAARDEATGLELDRMAVGGLALMERLVGYERAVLVDALLDAQPPGTVTTRPLAEVVSRLAGHLDSAHDAPVTQALTAGRALGAQLPSSITVVGVSVRVVEEFGERLSPEVEAAVGPAVEAVMRALALRPVGAA
ncbi:MAG TPA: hydrogenase maturation protease [Candidatus Limnocylindria bacterium]